MTCYYVRAWYAYYAVLYKTVTKEINKNLSRPNQNINQIKTE